MTASSFPNYVSVATYKANQTGNRRKKLVKKEVVGKDESSKNGSRRVSRSLWISNIPFGNASYRYAEGRQEVHMHIAQR